MLDDGFQRTDSLDFEKFVRVDRVNDRRGTRLQLLAGRTRVPGSPKGVGEEALATRLVASVAGSAAVALFLESSTVVTPLDSQP